jgi:heat shock protein HslJ
MKQVFLFSVAVLLLCSCNNSKQSTGDNNKSTLTDVYWKLTELNGQPVNIMPPDGREVYLVLHTAEKRASGNAGCNGYGGNYELNSNGFNIKFGPMIHTQMACGALETENAYLKVLESVDSYYVTDSSLQLNRARMAPLARFVAVKGKAIN